VDDYRKIFVKRFAFFTAALLAFLLPNSFGIVQQMFFATNSATFDPSSIAGLQLWLKADALGLADGTAVSSWTDSSGNSRHAAQATSANQPLLKTGILNSKPIVRFDGSNDFLQTAAFSVAQPLTVFSVAKTTSTATTYIFFDSAASSPRATLAVEPASSAEMNSGSSLLDGSLVVNTFQVWSAVFNGATSNIRLNGATGTSGNAGANGLNGVTIGARYAGDFVFPGDIAEVLVYNSALSATDRSSVETYLSRKYAIGRAFTYASDGDTNGVLYFSGQNFNAGGTWTNPHTAGYITVAGVPVGGAGSPATLVDRAASNYSTGGSGGAGNEWFLVDLGAGRSLLANKFSYRFRNDTTTFSPTGWTWEGSNDNSSWSTLATVTGQTPVASAWVSTTAAVQTTAYRYFRVKQTGNNNSGSSHMSIGELELYGTFTY
jgi:hypothetical protein